MGVKVNGSEIGTSDADVELTAANLPAALHYAINESDIFMLDTILDHALMCDETLNSISISGMTPLRRAACVGHAGVITRLVDSKCIVSGHENCALFGAIAWGNIEAVEVLLDLKANCNCQVGRKAETPLIQACRGHELNILQVLVERGADVNCGFGDNIPLKVCWKDQKLEMVKYLVAKGCKIGDAEWCTASESPNLCLNLAEGILARIEMNGYEGVPTISNAAFLLWLERAPKACATLFNDILVRVVTYNVPERAEIRGNITACYVDRRVFCKDSPAFKRLAPRDRGSGVNVDVSYFEMTNLMNVRVLDSLARSSETVLLESRAVEAVLCCTWKDYVQSVYAIDVIVEVIVLSTLVGWAITLPNDRRNSITNTFRQSSTIVLGLVAVRELVIEIIFVRYLISDLGFRFFSVQFLLRTNVTNLLNVACTLFLIYNVYSHDYDLPYTPSYLGSMSISAFLRWVRVLDFITAYELFGPAILPLIRSLNEIVTFSIVFFLISFAFVHAMYVFEVVKHLCTDDCVGVAPLPIYEFFIRQFYLGMVTRWSVFMTPLPANNYFYLIEIFWYAAAAFIVAIVMLQIFVGVMSEAYIQQRALSFVIFMQKRANICFTFFLARMGPACPERPAKGADIFLRTQYKIRKGMSSLPGMVQRPVDNGILWMCCRKEGKVVDHAENVLNVWQKNANHKFQTLMGETISVGETLEEMIDRVSHLERLIDSVISVISVEKDR